MTGGGKRLKTQTKSSCYSRAFFKKLKNLYKKLTFVRYDKIGGEGSRAESNYCYKSVSFRKLHLRSANCGIILIEFAICMPILIILLFYINDLVRLKRYYSQTEFVAQQMANILQNISQKREEANRKITCNDIRYAASLAYLSIFPGKTEFLTGNNSSDLGYRPLGFIYCIKGNADSTASVLWATRFHMATSGAESPGAVVFGSSAVNRTNIKKLSNASPSEIYPTLKIEKDQIKIIIECTLWTNRGSTHFFTDGTPFSSISHSQAFGFHLLKLSPPKTRDGYNNTEAFFHSAVIFTPKPGLFDETPPKEQN